VTGVRRKTSAKSAQIATRPALHLSSSEHPAKDRLVLREVQAARLMLFTKDIYTSCISEEWITRRQTVLFKTFKLG
jgi:hypothetical protein